MFQLPNYNCFLLTVSVLISGQQQKHVNTKLRAGNGVQQATGYSAVLSSTNSTTLTDPGWHPLD